MIILIYLIKVAICSILFSSYYFLVLRNKHFHQYNRYYILLSMALSVFLPLVSIPEAFYLQDSSGSLSKTLNTITSGGWEDEFILTAQTSFIGRLFSGQKILILFYAAGFFFFLVPLVKTLLIVRRISRKYEQEVIGNIPFYNTLEPGTPFSFFDRIYWNRAIALQSTEGELILRHELYHIRAGHSYDIIFMQGVSCLFWFIPAFHLMKTELKIIHEFLADKYAATETQKHQYAELLVMHALSSKEISITNQFFFNQIKRRIKMILKDTHTRFTYIRKALALPFVLLLFWACSSKSKDEFLPHTADNNAIFTKVELEGHFPGGREGWLQFLNKTFRYPQQAQDEEIQGTVVIQFVVEKDGQLTDIHAISGHPILADEALRVLGQSGKWIPARQNGQVVRSYRKQPISFRLEAQ